MRQQMGLRDDFPLIHADPGAFGPIMLGKVPAGPGFLRPERLVPQPPDRRIFRFPAQAELHRLLLYSPRALYFSTIRTGRYDIFADRRPGIPMSSSRLTKIICGQAWARYSRLII